MNYVIEELNVDNAYDYARVNTLAWLESYRGIVNDDFLEKINTEEEIIKTTERLKKGLDNKESKAFILKVNNNAVGVFSVGKSRNSKYPNYGELRSLYLLDEVKHKGYGKIVFDRALNELIDMGYNDIIIGCLEDNPSNEFYKYMGGKLIDTSEFIISNQTLIENIYCYENIKLLLDRFDKKR